MKNKNSHFKFFLYYIFFFLVSNLSIAQNNDDTKREILVLIKPGYIHFPVIERRAITLENVVINSQSLNQVLKRHNIEANKKSTLKY